MFIFDLQRFAEEAAAEDTQAEEATETVAEEPAAEEEPKEAIPDELAGVSEDVAREVMAKAQEAESQEGEEAQEQEDVTDAQTVVNQTADEPPLKQPNQKIPYARFKQQVDKTNELEAVLKQYQQRFGDLNAPQQAQPQMRQPPVQQAPQPPQRPVEQFQLTDENAKLINEAAIEGALQMTGMSKDDVAELEYSDDSDPKKQRFQLALSMAKDNIVTGLRQAALQKAQAAQKFQEIHQASAASFANYTNEQMKEADFEAVRNYATNEYFNALPPDQQYTIAGSWERISRNVASPAEMQVVRNYFEGAKNSYRSKHPQAKTSAGMTKTRMKQAAAMPRAGQIDGTAGGDAAVTAATLEHMLKTQPWEKIPQQYRSMMLGLG